MTDADLVAANALIYTRASELFHEVARAFPIVIQNPALEIAVSQAIDHCVRNFSPAQGELRAYVSATVGALVKRHRAYSNVVELDDNVLAGLEDGSVPLAAVMPIPSKLHAAELILEQMSESDQLKTRVMLHVKCAETREVIFGVQAIERARLEDSLVAQVKQLAQA